jgi:hypothetical protein
LCCFCPSELFALLLALEALRFLGKVVDVETVEGAVLDAADAMTIFTSKVFFFCYLKGYSEETQL